MVEIYGSYFVRLILRDSRVYFHRLNLTLDPPDKNKQYINSINKLISRNAFTYDIQHRLNISPAQSFTVISIRYDKYILK